MQQQQQQQQQLTYGPGNTAMIYIYYIINCDVIVLYFISQHNG